MEQQDKHNPTCPGPESSAAGQNEAPYKLLVFTCYGGCATGVAASRACIRIWEEHPDDVKIGCLPAVVVPWKLQEIRRNSRRRLLIDACGVRCGAALMEREGLTVDRYIELTSLMHLKKQKRLPSGDLEDEVYRIINREVSLLLDGVAAGHESSTEHQADECD